MASSQYSRKHFPWSFATGATGALHRLAHCHWCHHQLIHSGPRGWYTLCFVRPVSTTNRMPLMVSDVSAMFVARQSSGCPAGWASNTRICSSGGMAAKQHDLSFGFPSGTCSRPGLLSSCPSDSISSLTGEEHQHVSLIFPVVDLTHRAHRRVQVVILWRLRVERFHRVFATLAVHHRCTVEESREAIRFKRRGHHHQLRRAFRSPPLRACIPFSVPSRESLSAASARALRRSSPPYILRGRVRHRLSEQHASVRNFRLRPLAGTSSKRIA